jgi:hypothetical protein
VVEGFDLERVAAQAWRDLETGDRRVLAKEIAERIAPGDREQALLQALAEYCRRFNSLMRPTGYRPVAGARNTGRSAKVAAIRSTWPQLRATIATPDGQKPLGDCTHDDLIFHAGLLEQQARQHQRKASFERDLAAELATQGVTRVRDLSAEVLATYISGGKRDS